MAASCPVDAVSSAATLKGVVTLSQDAAQDAATDDSVEPATAGAVGADLTATDPEGAAAPTDDSVKSPATDTASNEALADSTDAVDPAQVESTGSETVDPASAAAAVDPATGEKVDPSTDQAGTPAPVDSTADTPAPSTAPEPLSTATTGGTEPPGEPIATAYITNTDGDGAPCLAAPEWGTETLAVLDEGVPVEVRAETEGEWQPVNCAGAGGYVQTSPRSRGTPPDPADPVATPDAGDDSGKRERKADDGGGASGKEIVDFALRYEGHPYVYAGEGPRAFDCSGFTMFVIQKTLGIDITHDMLSNSRWGARSDGMGCSLVISSSSRTPLNGLVPHGIYIGDGQFIHAENESTGVRISDLDSDYYSQHWYGAARYS